MEVHNTYLIKFNPMKTINHFVSLLFLIPLLFTGCTVTDQTTVSPESETQDEAFYQKDHFRYHDYIYKDNIKTVMLHKAGFELSMPIIKLNSNDQLFLSFDDLDADVKSYRYEIIHCNTNWKRSELSKYQYIKGYKEGLIEKYEFSFNTMEDFTHYTLKFPKENGMKPIVSGNYILSVYETGKKNDPAFTRRFRIYEPKVSISASVEPATPVDKRNTHHEIDFTIKLGDYYVADSHRNIKVKIMQNQRWDKIKKNIKPRSIRPEKLDYNYEGKIIFSGLNEYRFFDTRSLRHEAPGIERISYDSTGNHVTLKPDQRKTYKNYSTVNDINGNFYITSYEVNRQKELEADYTWVHFFLPYKAPLTDGNIYLMGSLTEWQFLEKGKMKYNYEMKGYEASLYLKQGYYNYHYVFLPNNSDTGNASMLEGEHVETENNYTIFVYHRPSGEIYDKLIAVEKINSRKEENEK